jgi:hypothetical protein
MVSSKWAAIALWYRLSVKSDRTCTSEGVIAVLKRLAFWRSLSPRHHQLIFESECTTQSQRIQQLNQFHLLNSLVIYGQ